MNILRTHINRVGREVEAQRKLRRVQVSNRQHVISAVAEGAGLYWIETNMPTEELLGAIRQVSMKNKKIRKTKPKGVGFTKLIDEFQVVYSGTGHAIQTRLLEHLFNIGNEMTAKLSAVIDRSPFSNYNWYISTVYVDDYPSRYALESWWRLNIGWPPFCIR